MPVCSQRRKDTVILQKQRRGWQGLYVGIVGRFYTKWNVYQSHRASQDSEESLDFTYSNSQRFLQVLSREVTLSHCAHLKKTHKICVVA